MAVLKYLGVFRDLGVVLSIVGLMLTMLFGLTVSTRSSVAGFRADVIPALERIERLLTERHPARIAPQTPGRSSWNARAVLEHGLAGRALTS